MEVSLKLNGTKELTLKPISEQWKEYAPLIKDSETYIVVREPNSTSIILKQVKEKEKA